MKNIQSKDMPFRTHNKFYQPQQQVCISSIKMFPNKNSYIQGEKLQSVQKFKQFVHQLKRVKMKLVQPKIKQLSFHKNPEQSLSRKISKKTQNIFPMLSNNTITNKKYRQKCRKQIIKQFQCFTQREQLQKQQRKTNRKLSFRPIYEGFNHIQKKQKNIRNKRINKSMINRTIVVQDILNKLNQSQLKFIGLV